MPQTQYLCLLRGINVGGKNIIKMSELVKCFEDMGFSNVLSYIQSGNILFCSNEKNKTKLILKIEKALSKKYAYKYRIVLVSQDELNESVKKSPKDFGKQPNKYKYDVVFLKEPLTTKDTMNVVSIREGVDLAQAGKNVLYFSRLISKASKSCLSKIISHPDYKFMTIRNWNTTTSLLKIMETSNE